MNGNGKSRECLAYLISINFHIALSFWRANYLYFNYLNVFIKHVLINHVLECITECHHFPSGEIRILLKFRQLFARRIEQLIYIKH